MSNPFREYLTKTQTVTYNDKRLTSLPISNKRIENLISKGWTVTRHENNVITGYNCVTLENQIEQK